MDVARVFDAFIYTQDIVQGPLLTGGNVTYAEQYFSDLSQTKYVVVSAFYVVTTAVGDGFMVSSKSQVTFVYLLIHRDKQIYRLYVVWNRTLWIIVIPLMSFITMCGACQI